MGSLRASTGIVVGVSGCPAPLPDPIEYPEGAVAFAEVDVVWMGDDRVLVDRTVVVHGGRIIDVFPG